MRARLAPVHPGEVLRGEFLSPLEISQRASTDETGRAVTTSIG